MKKTSKKENSFFKKSLPFIITYLIIVLFQIFYKLAFYTGGSLNISSYIFDFIIYLNIYLFILGIVKKSSTANLIYGIFFIIFNIIDCFKMYYTNDPILFSDVKYLSDIFEITSIVDDSFFFAFGTVALPIISFTILSVILIVLSYRKKFNVSKASFRILFVVIPIVFFTVILGFSKEVKPFMMKNVYHLDESKDFNVSASNLGHYGKYGFFSGMYMHLLENIIDVPEDFDSELIENMVNNTSISTDKKLKNPNIIVLFSESFWDISKISDEVSFDKEVTSNLNKLKNEGIYFEMISPSFGGISGNVEFEFLTGANMSYFGSGYVPYMQLYTNKNYYNAPSIIHELNNNNYRTKVVAYTGPRLFNCSKFYKYAGFDEKEFIYEEDLLNLHIDEKYKKGDRVSDEHVVDEIIKEFDNKNPNEKLFYMTLTMQGHTPYRSDKYSDLDISIKNSVFNDELNGQILSYAQGVYDADKQLGRLYEYINTLDEDTIIVFYGDHLPYYTDQSGNSVYTTSKYFNTSNEYLNYYRKYNTQALILANFEIEESNYNYVSPDLLSTYILNNMDINISSYYKWLYTNLETMPSLNKLVMMDKIGNIYSILDLPDDMKNYYRLRQSVQYNYFVYNK